MKKRKLSINSVILGVKDVLQRFPLTIIFSLAWTIVNILTIYNDGASVYMRGMFVLSLAIVLSVGVVLMVEALGKRREWSWFLSLVLVAILSIYYVFLPDIDDPGMFIPYIRHMMWIVAGVIAVVVLPFVKQCAKETSNIVWSYGVRLLATAVFTFAWAVAMYLGIITAIFSTAFLFDLDIDERLLPTIWIVILGVFCTTFFLARVPRSTKELTNFVYPKELRLFSQWVLVPIVSVYMVILYAYSAKVLFTMQWPEGFLAYIILGFSLVGLITYISLYPLREKSLWIKRVGIVLCVVMIPQMLMLFYSLWFRVSDYGWTENRYFVAVYGAWLLGICLYFLISKKKDIRILPVSLIAILVLGSFGPWSASSVSVRSQVNRLESILEMNNRIVDGSYVASEEEVSKQDLMQIESVLQYLQRRDAFDSVQELLSEPVDLSEVSVWKQADTILDKGFGLSSSGQVEDDPLVRFSFSEESPVGLLEDGTYFFEIDMRRRQEFEVDGKVFEFEIDKEDLAIDVLIDEEVIGEIDLRYLIDQAVDESDEDRPVVTTSNDRFESELYVKILDGNWQGSEVSIHLLNGILFLELK